MKILNQAATLNWALAFQRLRIVLYALIIIVAQTLNWSSLPTVTSSIAKCGDIARRGVGPGWMIDSPGRYTDNELCDMLVALVDDAPRKLGESWRDAPLVLDKIAPQTTAPAPAAIRAPQASVRAAAQPPTSDDGWDVVSTEPYRPAAPAVVDDIFADVPITGAPRTNMAAQAVPPPLTLRPLDQRAFDLQRRATTESLLWEQASHVINTFGWSIVAATMLELLAQVIMWVLGGLWVKTQQL